MKMCYFLATRRQQVSSVRVCLWPQVSNKRAPGVISNCYERVYLTAIAMILLGTPELQPQPERAEASGFPLPRSRQFLLVSFLPYGGMSSNAYMAENEVFLLSNFLFWYAFILCVKGYNRHPSRFVSQYDCGIGNTKVVEMRHYQNL